MTWVSGRHGARPMASSSPRSLLSVEERSRLDTYLDTLFEYNARMNLTAVKDKKEAEERHIEDSLALLPILDSVSPGGERGRPKVIDVGTGAGLPGVVVAVMRENWEVTLLDSLQKRCKFLSDVKERIGLGNATVRWGRAEDVGRDQEEGREAYDIAVARAVAELRVLVELCAPMVRVGGHIVAAKGPSPEEEIVAAGNALEQLNCEVVRVDDVPSFGAKGQRTVVVIRKVEETPEKFPRQPGKPNKRPL